MKDEKTEQLLRKIAEVEKENAVLKEENERLNEEKGDLEILIEMSAEHSDGVEQALLDKADSFKEISDVILQTIPVSIIISRISDSTALYVNDQFCSLLGLTKEEIIGNMATDFFYEKPSDRQPLIDAIEKNGCADDLELRCRKADGMLLWLTVFSRPLAFNGESCLLTAVYDKSERKRAEEEIRKLSEKLEAQKKQIKKYLVFNLADTRYAICLSEVKEITEMMPVTRVPHAPDFIKGVVNLRGRIIPVVDLRLKFDMESDEYTDKNCIIITETEEKRVGMIVDTVSEVLNVRGEDIEELPLIYEMRNIDCISGIAKAGDGVIVILDIQSLLREEELSLLPL
ncbi:chemotaxis protein CheW [Desulfobacterales bacterium HSG2]|nr:chemotaxis protein CheW [Desulfobacterales bacterium HSG2]